MFLYRLLLLPIRLPCFFVKKPHRFPTFIRLKNHCLFSETPKICLQLQSWPVEIQRIPLFFQDIRSVFCDKMKLLHTLISEENFSFYTFGCGLGASSGNFLQFCFAAFIRKKFVGRGKKSMNSGDTESSGNSAGVVRAKKIITLLLFGCGNTIRLNRKNNFWSGSGSKTDNTIFSNGSV